MTDVISNEICKEEPKMTLRSKDKPNSSTSTRSAKPIKTRRLKILKTDYSLKTNAIINSNDMKVEEDTILQKTDENGKNNLYNKVNK